MTQLKDKIQSAMDESRTLVLGAEILIGFDFTAPFQEGFKRISGLSRDLNILGLALMLFTLVLLLAPAPFHQLAMSGQDTAILHRFATHAVELALGPFAVALGIAMYPVAEEIGGRGAGWTIALSTLFLAFTFWYGPMFLKREQEKRGGKENSMSGSEESSETGKTSIHDKIRQVLTESRMIIPGNQALLGFQFAIVLQQGFRDLAPWLKWIHLWSLSFITLSTIVLLTPAAYHRIVENGEETERFYRVANTLVLWSLPPLALGICGDFFLVTYKMSGSLCISLAAAALMLALFVVCGLDIHGFAGIIRITY